ncbi:glycosyl hydrolase family 28-related protein [Paenibacillus sp. YIM B09110]|uniref:glycosyl hydrolase family 28-related protein n=1 Tax=Paenibacillus sp. YIM B09110 TaxID=3126102 RepID=UPI00301C2499
MGIFSKLTKSMTAMVLVTILSGIGFYGLFIEEANAASMINVKTYGAKGDGKTDDTSSIKKALAEGAAKKTTVYFPKGTYLVNPKDPLAVSSNVKVLGDGATSIIKASTKDFGWELMRVSGKDIEISNISLDGNKLVNRVLVVSGGSERVNVNKSIVANASHSTKTSSDYFSGVLSGILVYGNTKAITIDSNEVKNIVAINPTGGSMIARGIYVTTTWGKSEAAAANVSITNNYIHHIGPADDGDGIYYEDPNMDSGKGIDTNSIISNNKFDNNAKRAIKIYAQGLTVTGNQILNSYLQNNYYASGSDKGSIAPDMYSAISVYGSNNTIKSNTISGIGSFYAAIEVGAVETVNNIVVSNNKITMGPKSVQKGKTAIRLGNINKFTIDGNVIENGDKGIWTWQNADNGSITNNKIKMTSGGGIDLTTYLAQFSQKNIVCSNNTIQATQFIVKLASSNFNVQVL